MRRPVAAAAHSPATRPSARLWLATRTTRFQLAARNATAGAGAALAEGGGEGKGRSVRVMGGRAIKIVCVGEFDVCPSPTTRHAQHGEHFPMW